MLSHTPFTVTHTPPSRPDRIWWQPRAKPKSWRIRSLWRTQNPTQTPRTLRVLSAMRPLRVRFVYGASERMDEGVWGSREWTVWPRCDAIVPVTLHTDWLNLATNSQLLHQTPTLTTHTGEHGQGGRCRCPRLSRNHARHRQSGRLLGLAHAYMHMPGLHAHAHLSPMSSLALWIQRLLSVDNRRAQRTVAAGQPAVVRCSEI